MANEENNVIREDLQDIADQLRAIGQTGLFYARREDDEYDIARYERVLALAARLFALTDTRGVEEILAIYNGDIGVSDSESSGFWRAVRRARPGVAHAAVGQPSMGNAGRHGGSRRDGGPSGGTGILGRDRRARAR